MDERAVAAVVSTVLETLLAPLAERLARLEVGAGEGKAYLGELAGAVSTIRTESGTAGREALAAVAGLRERVAVLEVREPVPGPPGPAGEPGKDGAAGLRYLGVFVEGKAYEPGDVVTWNGSAWHCHDATAAKPGDASRTWRLMVKCGRDGRDREVGR